MKYRWTPSRIERLRQMAKTGRTSYEISRALGCCRNSVCSRCHRMGIRLRGRPFGPVNRGGAYRWGSLKFRRVRESQTVGQA